MSFYRNTIEVVSLEGVLVDAQSLWQLDPNQTNGNVLLVLVDEDQYVTAFLDLKSFQPCEEE